jgi:hypothetical protein
MNAFGRGSIPTDLGGGGVDHSFENKDLKFG